MSVIWNKLIETQDRILGIFDEFAVEKEEKTLNKFHCEIILNTLL